MFAYACVLRLDLTVSKEREMSVYRRSMVVTDTKPCTRGCSTLSKFALWNEWDKQGGERVTPLRSSINASYMQTRKYMFSSFLAKLKCILECAVRGDDFLLVTARIFIQLSVKELPSHVRQLGSHYSLLVSFYVSFFSNSYRWRMTPQVQSARRHRQCHWRENIEKIV